MSRPRYASITSHLLVRKGEAAPWQMPGSEIANAAQPAQHRDDAESKAFFDDAARRVAEYESWKGTQAADTSRRDEPLVEDAHDHDVEHAAHHEAAGRTKRCAFRLTPAEHERLGIIGVKRNLTRQQLLRRAIEHYLGEAKAEFRESCACLSGGACHGDC
jgi:hypothetical protein